MKNTKNITMCAMMAALSALFMLTSFFPYLTYAIPAVAGLFIMIAVIETGVKWGFAAYAASAIIVALFSEPEAMMLYIAFFGYYPILKAVFERIKSRVVEYILKFAVFNTAILLAYFVIANLFSIPVEGMGDFGKYTAVILIIAANVVFPIYDLAVTRMASFYIVRLHPSVNRIFKGK